MNWTDEKLAALDKDQLKSLLENLATQRASGRVSEEIAVDLATRISARLPASVLSPKRKRPRALILLDARVAEALGDVALLLSRRYDLSEETARERSADTAGFRPQQLTNKHGEAKAGASMKNGKMAIDRYISYRVRNSLAGLAFLLAIDQPQQSGRYVVLATEDLLDTGVPMSEVLPTSGDYSWSRESRERMRAHVAADFAEAQQMYEDLIARVATKRPEEQ